MTDGSKSENVRYRKTQRDITKEILTYQADRKVIVNIVPSSPQKNKRDNIVVDTKL
jgi:hypothetical protein